MPNSAWIGHLEQQVLEGRLTELQATVMQDSMLDCQNVQPPEMVKPVSRFWRCLEVLLEFIESETPPEVVVCTTNSILLVYGYANASGSGFGSSLLIHGDVKYCIGTWAQEEGGNSSKWRELENLVSSMEDAGQKG